MVVLVVRAAHQDLILYEVASELATAEADPNPVLLILRWLLVRGRLFLIEWMYLDSMSDSLGGILGQNPGISAASVKDSSHFLWFMA